MAKKTKIEQTHKRPGQTVTVYPFCPFDPVWKRQRYSFTLRYEYGRFQVSESELRKPAAERSDIADQSEVERLNSQADIVILLGEDESIPAAPPEGTGLDDPLSHEEKTLLAQLGLAARGEPDSERYLRMVNEGKDPLTVFTVDRQALKAYLSRELGIVEERLPGLNWRVIMGEIHKRTDAPEKPDTPVDKTIRDPVSKCAQLILKRLNGLPEDKGMVTDELLVWLSVEHKRDIDDRTLRRHLDELKPYGLQNKPKIGYYIR